MFKEIDRMCKDNSPLCSGGGLSGRTRVFLSCFIPASAYMSVESIIMFVEFQFGVDVKSDMTVISHSRLESDLEVARMLNRLTHSGHKLQEHCINPANKNDKSVTQRTVQLTLQLRVAWPDNLFNMLEDATILFSIGVPYKCREAPLGQLERLGAHVMQRVDGMDREPEPDTNTRVDGPMGSIASGALSRCRDDDKFIRELSSVERWPQQPSHLVPESNQWRSKRERTHSDR